MEKNHNAKADISRVIVDLSYYARDNIPNYRSIAEIPQENLEYLNSGLVAGDMSFMFNYCSNLLSIPKLNIDTSNVSSMQMTFSYLNSATSLNLSWLNTRNVTTMQSMFYSYPTNKFTSLDLSNFDTSNVSKMGAMFYYCGALTSLDLSNFDTGNVIDTHAMFFNCTSLTTIKGVIDMRSCNNYSNMFGNCNKLSGVQIKNPPDFYYSNKESFESRIGLSSSQYEIVS